MTEDDENNFLTEEDSELWKEVTKDDKRLPGKKIENPSIKSEEITKFSSSSSRDLIAGSMDPVVNPQDDKVYKYLKPGDPSRVDGKTAEKLRKGKIKVEAKLDLHGYKQDEAIEAVGDFIDNTYEKGKRCVLVITGKGTFKEGAGVLRENLPRWLNAPSTRPKILMYTYARGEHGGEGAVYVYLRKNY